MSVLQTWWIPSFRRIASTSNASVHDRKKANLLNRQPLQRPIDPELPELSYVLHLVLLP
jgi:hypothetical protein